MTNQNREVPDLQYLMEVQAPRNTLLFNILPIQKISKKPLVHDHVRYLSARKICKLISNPLHTQESKEFKQT